MLDSQRWPSNLLAWIFFIAPVAAQVPNVTMDDLSSTITLIPLEDWQWSDEGTGANDGAFSFSSSENATVIFTFPAPATAVSWQGFKRSDAATYSLCIDCPGNLDDTGFIAVDGYDANAKPTDPVTTLFSQTGLSNAIHNITIKNALDSRFLRVGQITVDSFIITSSQHVDPSKATLLPAGPSSTAIVGDVVSNPLSVSSSLSSSLATPPSRPLEAATVISRDAIVGIVIGGVAFIFFILGLVWWSLRKVRQKQSSTDFSGPENVDSEASLGPPNRNLLWERRSSDNLSGSYISGPMPPLPASAHTLSPGAYFPLAGARSSFAHIDARPPAPSAATSNIIRAPPRHVPYFPPNPSTRHPSNAGVRTSGRPIMSLSSADDGFVMVFHPSDSEISTMQPSWQHVPSQPSPLRHVYSYDTSSVHSNRESRVSSAHFPNPAPGTPASSKSSTKLSQDPPPSLNSSSPPMPSASSHFSWTVVPPPTITVASTETDESPPYAHPNPCILPRGPKNLEGRYDTFFRR